MMSVADTCTWHKCRTVIE